MLQSIVGVEGFLAAIARVTVSVGCLLIGQVALRFVWKIFKYQRLRTKFYHIPWMLDGCSNLDDVPSFYKAMPLLMMFSQAGGVRDFLRLHQDPKTKEIRPIMYGGCSPTFEPFVTIADSKCFGMILNDLIQFPKERGLYDLYEPILGRGLITAEGEEHKKQRKIITPVFHFAALKSAMKVIERNAAHFVDHELVASDLLITQRSFKSVTLGIITDFSFTGAFDKKWMEKAWHRILTFFQLQIFCRIFIGEYVRYLPNPCSIYLFLVRRTIVRFIADRRVHLQRHNITQAAVIQAVGTDQDSAPTAPADTRLSIDLGMSLADQLILAGNPDWRIMDECTTFLFAGPDSSGSMLAWASHELARAPDVQQRVREELARVLGPGPVRAVPYEAVARLEYLTAVLKEVLRLWPPVSQLCRTNLHPDLVIGGHAVPRGAAMNLCFFAAHRDPAVWPDPDEFRPGRWLAAADSEAARRRHPYAFVPFLAGPRGCVGQKLGLAIGVGVLAALLSRYELLEARPGAAAGVVPVVEGIMEPRGLAVRCRPLPAQPEPAAAAAAAAAQ